ncbi:PEP-utilizing enzyme [Pseudonocardia spinosispora]|uniref:PEP-utilizing enzyme n=1 Tax=Pseudonocardia spinosispora TaxID=103441 RepID=UPI00041FE533|nr:PEP-utilizing enzyme [Pseudonocardia spinosispora]
MKWEFDDLASSLYPLYSRAVVGDLCPTPVSPLTATVGVGAELGPAWARVYTDTGLRPAPEPGAEAAHHPAALFGAHLYLNTSLLRLFGVYASGADPMAFARQYLGERPDVPRQRDERPTLEATAERLRSWTASVLSGQTDHSGAARRFTELRAGRPQLRRCSDADLVARITALRAPLRETLRFLAEAELATAVTSDLLTRATEEAGFPGLTGALVAGHGGSATAPIDGLWQLAKRVSASDRLTRLFDKGVSAAAVELGTTCSENLRSFLAENGHFGPAEWELSADTWGTDAHLMVRLVDVLRRGTDQPDPASRARSRANLSAQTASTIRGSLRGSPVASARFDEALTASARWLPARHGLRRIVSGLHHEQRLAARELGRRHTESGLLDEVDQIFMLLEPELGSFLSDPSAHGESLRMRAYDYRALAAYQPPFVTIGAPPPVVRWQPRPSPKQLSGRRILPGTAAGPGLSAGRTVVLATPASPSEVRPGDVLVLPTGGPGWVPLLPVAGAVVVDGGSALCDVAVACRDLGVACVVATVDATSRLGTGASVQVDGFSGSVALTERTASAKDTGQDDLPRLFSRPTSSTA